jgi:hypothetical protein
MGGEVSGMLPPVEAAGIEAAAAGAACDMAISNA